MASPPPPPAGAAAAAPAAPGSPPPAQVVGNAFVHQYYNILHQSPELVHRFYQDASRLGRPAGAAADGMDTVTTMDAINDKIVSMGITRAEIKSVDAQESQSGGVTVLVMGHLTGRSGGASREFVQSFFLAPQEKGYYVLNDILRYVGEGEEGAEQPVRPPTPEVDAEEAPAAVLANGTVGGDTETVPRAQDASPQPEELAAEPTPQAQEKELLNGVEVSSPPNDVDKHVVEETPVAEVINEVPNNVAAAAPSSSLAVPVEEAPKKSYASIAVAEEEDLHQVEVVTSEAKALEVVALTTEAEAMEGASSIIDPIMVAEVVAEVAHHVEVMLATSGSTTLVLVVVVLERHPLLLRLQSEFVVAVRP
nr:unnamed protein product [Digitaria exilis]